MTRLDTEGKLTCQQAEEMLVDYLYGELSREQEEAFRLHLQECQPHRDEVRSLQAVLGLVRQQPAEIPEEVSGRIRSAVRDKLRQQEPSRSWFWWLSSSSLPAALAAGLAVVVLSVALWRLAEPDKHTVGEPPCQQPALVAEKPPFPAASPAPAPAGVPAVDKLAQSSPAASGGAEAAPAETRVTAGKAPRPKVAEAKAPADIWGKTGKGSLAQTAVVEAKPSAAERPAEKKQKAMEALTSSEEETAPPPPKYGVEMAESLARGRNTADRDNGVRLEDESASDAVAAPASPAPAAPRKAVPPTARAPAEMAEEQENSLEGAKAEWQRKPLQPQGEISRQSAGAAAEAEYENARAFFKAGDCEKQIMAAKRAVDLAPRHRHAAQTLLEQASCLVKLGRFDQARDVYRRVERDYPAFAEEARGLLRRLEGR